MEKAAEFINKTIKAILAFFWSVFSMVIITVMYFGIGKSETSLQTQIITGVFGISMLLLGYFFGSSDSSAKKTAAMEKLAKDNQELNTGTNGSN